MINEVRLIGNVGRDPEIRQFQSGPMATLSLATTEKWKDGRGDWQEKTQWHNLVAFGRVADNIDKYIRSGMMVYVEGSIEYTERDEKRYTNIKVRKAKIMNDRGKGDDNYNSRSDSKSYDDNLPEPPPGYHGVGDDVPF